MPIDQKAWTIIETKRWTNAIETVEITNDDFATIL
jgi:hypothetical protein